MILFINAVANEDFSLTINKPANTMQFSFKRQNGEVLLLEEHMPKNDRGNFFDITNNMRKAIAIHYPNALGEFDEALALRKERIEKIDSLIRENKTDSGTAAPR